MTVVVDLANTLPQLQTGWCPGDRVAAYIVRSLIGRGGMGGVWEGWDPELQRTVALKSIEAPDCGDDVLVNEARALAAVRHAALPTVHGLGTHRGRRFLVLERLYGDTLPTLLVGAQPVEARQFVSVIASLPAGAAMEAVLAAIANT